MALDFSKFTREAVNVALDHAVEKRGEDFVYDTDELFPDEGDYRSCRYADDDGNPSCIVGEVIYEIDPELFKEIAEDFNTDRFRVIVATSQRINLLGSAARLTSLFHELDEAQRKQDTGVAWGQVREEVKR